MTAREQFEAIVRRQLAVVREQAIRETARYLGTRLDIDHIVQHLRTGTSGAQAAITAGGQQLAAAYTGAALSVHGEPCDDAAVVGLVNETRGVIPARSVPAQRQVTR